MAAVLKSNRDDGQAAPAGSLDQTHLKRLVGYNLRRAEIHMRALVARTLESEDVKAVEYSILALISGNTEVTQKDLGEALAVKRPNMVKLVERLETRGLVARAVMPRDRRNHLLTLTPDGFSLLARLDGHLDALEADVFRSWSEAERNALKTFLARLHGA